MSRLCYVDCVAGVAGDMLLGALLDAGADPETVREGLDGLGIEGLGLRLWREERHAMSAQRLEVLAPAERGHRTWADIRWLLDGAALPARARERAQAVFARLAEAEARIHDVEPERVHFHEVGAADALGDVCGIALALEDLGVGRLACSPLPVPRGLVDAAHGRLPLPAPATLELLKGAPLHGVDLEAELVTPTGAAAVAALAEGFGPLPPLRLEAVGYGAGARDLEALPNVARVLVGEPLDGRRAAPVALIETNVDDMAPELVPDAAAGAVAAGALDVWTTPVQMKKGRPGVVISALARPEAERPVVEALFRGTSTLGVRVARLDRFELEREWRTVAVGDDAVRVKIGRLDGRVVSAAPEHEDCARVAERTGETVRAVWSAAFAQAQRAGAAADGEAP